MVSRNELEREIELISGMMGEASPEERDYLVGKSETPNRKPISTSLIMIN